MTFEKLSQKQKQVFQWCYKTDYKAIICDGAVRSGKTICMITSFILWAMKRFNGATFGICGKTVASAERNIIRPIQGIVDITAYFKISYSTSKHLLTVENKATRNYFFVFGGKDESSYELLQGITLSGIFLDEVALMPQSFVNQAIARTLSVENSRYWFNCNPESPAHWFYNEWVLQAENKNALHIHFLMSDNPILTEKQLKEAENQFTGVFYQRYIHGLWVLAEGLIYPMYKDAISEVPNSPIESKCLSIDYGTQNPFAVLYWEKHGGVWYAVNEYYYSGRTTNRQKTDDEYGEDMDQFVEPYLLPGEKLETIIDPSAASFIALLKKKSWSKVRTANNAVEDGIRETASAMHRGLIKFSPTLKNWRKECESYVWEEGTEKPLKENDHLMDSMRYFVKTKHIARVKRTYRDIY